MKIHARKILGQLKCMTMDKASSYWGVVMSKLSSMLEIWDFLKERKKWWLGPIILALVILGILIVLTEGSAIAPFIYTLF